VLKPVVTRAAREGMPDLCRDLELGEPFDDRARQSLIRHCRSALDAAFAENDRGDA
jgi:hypothetical protein